MGILMVLMALQVFGVVNVIPHIHFDEHTMKRGYAGAFLTGALGGLFASHCAIPVMVALLALVARLGKSTGWGSLNGFICTWAQHFAQICSKVPVTVM